MAVVSRLVLNHPALGTAGGAGLHASIEALYQKIGDAVANRWFSIADFDQTETVDLEHNFDTDSENLRYDLYNFTGGQWVLLTDTSSPLRSAFTVIEKVGFEDVTLQITNVSGGNNLTFAVVVTNDPLHLSAGDIKDVDTVTTPPQDGQALVYEASSNKFKPGASGDASLKLQSVTDPNLVLKGGFLRLVSGKEVTTWDGAGDASTDHAGDITVNLDTIGGTPTGTANYYLYIDLEALGSEVTFTDNGRKVYRIAASETSKFFISTNSPTSTSINRARYRYLGGVRLVSSAWSSTLFWSSAEKVWDETPVAINPVVYTDEDHSIGTVGSAGQLATYGALATADLAAILGATASFWNFDTDDGASISDDSGNGRSLTKNGSVAFRAVGLFSKETLADLDGVDDNFSSGHADFNVTTGSFSIGGWCALKWSQTGAIIGRYNDATNLQYLLYHSATHIRFSLSSDGAATTDLGVARTWADGELHHVVAVFDNPNNLAKIYIDGQLAVTQAFASNLFSASANFRIGAHEVAGVAATFARGKIQDMFFSSNVLTDSQVNILYSKRFKKQQLAGGHTLSADSFPLVSLSNKVAFWTLSDDQDGSVNNKDLTGDAAPTNFTGIGLFGNGDAATFNGTTQSLKSTDSFFDYGGVPFSYGCFAAANDYTPSARQIIMSFSDGASDKALIAIETTGNITWEIVDSVGTKSVSLPNPGLIDGSYHHFAASIYNNTMYAYLDGLLVGTVSLASLMVSLASPVVRISGRRATLDSPFGGRICNGFAAKNLIFTSSDIRKIFSARLDLAGLLPASTSQQWLADILSEDGLQTYDLGGESFIVDKSPTGKVWVDFGSQSTSDVADRVTLRCKDLALTAAVVPSTVPFDATYTANPSFPLTHGLPEVPQLVLMAKNASSEWITLDSEGVIKATSTQILGDLSNLFTLGYTNVRVKGIVGNSPTGVKLAGAANDGLLGAQQFEAFTAIKNSNYTAIRGDKVLTDSSGGAFTVTLPASPNVNDKVEVYDVTGSWGTANVTLGRNGSNINGVAANYTLNVSDKMVTAVYVSVGQGWRIYG